MPDHEGRLPAFYDHETEEPRGTGRRRRQVADWGVDEHVFDRMPSRRFGRRGGTPASARWRARGWGAGGGPPPRGSGEAERFVRRRAEAESWDDSAGWEEP